MTDGKLTDMIKKIGEKCPSYAMQLAMKTYAPQIENLLTDLRNLAMELNEFAVDDCYAVQSLFAGALPKNSAMYETVCRDLASGNDGSDYLKSRESCKKNETARQQAKAKQQQNPDVLIDDYNLFVVAAKKAKIPNDMIEPTMAIAGTVVVKGGKKIFYDSLVFDQDTFNAHLKGGKASSYHCNLNSGCLDISNSDEVISLQNSYHGKAQSKLQAIKKKMLTNTAFNAEDKDFLTSIGESFPIYNYLSLEVVTGANIMDKSSELVASYMILHYLGKIINEVKQAIHTLESNQLDDQHCKDYIERLDRVQDFVHQKSTGLFELARITEKRAESIEKHYIAKIK
jgi:conjugative transfer pilus assembly protein TraH